MRLIPRYTFILVLVSALGLAGTAYSAEGVITPSNLRSISNDRIHEIEQLHERAEEHILKNDFRGAIRAYNDIVLDEPDDETAYTGLAQCYMVLGDYPRAKNAYLNALHINPNNQTAILGIQKIQDPDSMNFIEKSTENHSADTQPVQAVNETTIPTPIPAEIPLRYPQKIEQPSKVPSENTTAVDDIHLGAKKSMAPYSMGIPKPIKELSRAQLIQAALKNAGFYRGPIDGILGTSTHTAIKNFQRRYDLVPDGKVGPKTWELLQPYINQNAFEEKILKNGTSV